MGIEKRLTDLEKQLLPGPADQEIIIFSWGVDGEILEERRPLAPGEIAKPGITVDWTVPDEQPKAAA